MRRACATRCARCSPSTRASRAASAHRVARGRRGCSRCSTRRTSTRRACGHWRKRCSSPRSADSGRRRRSPCCRGSPSSRVSSAYHEARMIVTVDGRRVELAAGATVLDAVNRLGLALPQLCKDPDRAPLGACRTCLVHVEGQRGTPAACHLPARDGMVVDTQHPEVVRVRSMVLDLTLSMLTPPGEYEGGVAPLTRTARNGFGQLGDATARHGRLEPSWAPLHAYDEDASKSFFVLDRDACILCGRCAVACDDVQQIGAIALLGRGHATKVGVFGDGPMSSSVCTACGQCVATCPTGALRPKEAPGKIARTVGTTCPYCGVGCGIELKVRDDGRLAIMADDVPANHSSLGMLCVKGRFATGFVP